MQIQILLCYHTNGRFRFYFVTIPMVTGTDEGTIGSMSFWHDYFGAARFVVVLFCVAYFVAGPF